MDPLTGEGIHTAMQAGKIAAAVVGEMHQRSNWSLDACEAYVLRCRDAFVDEFAISALAARCIASCPLLLDAMAVVGQRHGQPFLDFFGETMTGVKPKHAMIVEKPLFAAELTIEIIRQFVLQYVLRKEPLIPSDIGQKVIDTQAKQKSEQKK